MFWSLIPWRKLLKLALPFIREMFIGKFNFKGYFAKHPVITLSVIVITLSAMSMLFMTEQAVYHATKSLEYQTLLAKEQAKVEMFNKKLKGLEKVQCTPQTEPVQKSQKEVVLVPLAKPAQKHHYQKIVAPLPTPAPKVPIKDKEIVALPVFNYPTVKDKLYALDEDR